MITKKAKTISRKLAKVLDTPTTRLNTECFTGGDDPLQKVTVTSTVPMPDFTLGPIPHDLEHFESPESSNIYGAVYDIDKKVLNVTFKHKGGHISIYQYADFNPEDWHHFKQAESKGKFFAASIRNHYTGILL